NAIRLDCVASSVDETRTSNTSAGASTWKVSRDTPCTCTPANRASRKPALAMAKTGKRSFVKISRRSAAASVTPEHDTRWLIYFGTRGPDLEVRDRPRRGDQDENG